MIFKDNYNKNKMNKQTDQNKNFDADIKKEIAAAEQRKGENIIPEKKEEQKFESLSDSHRTNPTGLEGKPHHCQNPYTK
jgi:hypothetical protein